MSASPLFVSQHLLILTLTGLDPAADRFNDVEEISTRTPCCSAGSPELNLPWPLRSQGLKDWQMCVCLRMSVCASKHFVRYFLIL